MSNKIQSQINNVLGDGARNAKFRCFVDVPSGGSAKNTSLDILCKNAVFPGKQLETIEYKHKGHSILVPGHEKFTQQFSLTFYLEEDHSNRKLFDSWMQQIVHYNYSDKSINHLSPDQITREMYVSQLNFEMDTEVVRYIFLNAYPIEISAIELSSDSINTISEYTVTFAYSHYDIDYVGGMLSANAIADKLKSYAQGIVNTVIGKGVTYLQGTSLVKGLDSSISSAGSYLNDSVTKIGSNIKNFLG